MRGNLLGRSLGHSGYRQNGYVPETVRSLSSPPLACFSGVTILKVGQTAGPNKRCQSEKRRRVVGRLRMRSSVTVPEGTGLSSPPSEGL